MVTPDKTEEAIPVDILVDENTKRCCSIYDGNTAAKGYSWLGAGRGTLSMANIFLNQAFLFLAYQAAGCELADSDACENKIYGFYPASWIAVIPVIAGLFGCFTSPILGALVDFSDYRRGVGISTACIIIAIQAVQIYTVDSTWFVMLWFQALAVAIYYWQLVAAYAYLPEIARVVGESKMAGFTANFQSIQFGTQALFLVAMAIVAAVGKQTQVVNGQISQGLNTLTCLFFFGVGWFKYLSRRNAVRKLPEGHSMILEGFRSNFKTIKSIQKDFKKGIRWFFLALAFSQASAQAITSLSAIYLADTLKMNTLNTSLFYLDVLVISLAGCQISAKVSRKYNPNVSYTLSVAYLYIVVVIGLVSLERLPKWCPFIWGAFVGIGLGWLFGTEPLYLSMLMPVGQEAEISGFYNFVSQILAWCPPLIFAVMSEAKVGQSYSLIAATSFFVPAIALLTCSGKWEEILEETKAGGVEGAMSDHQDVEP